MRLTLGLILLLVFSSAAQAAELTVVTRKGYVSFTADDEWTMIGTQTKLPVAAVAFQVIDPADEGTPDSTNVVVSLYDPKSPEGKDAMKLIGKKYGALPPAVSRVGQWEVFDQQTTQNGTEYTVLDAVREVADVAVSLRLAWPNLPNHAQDYQPSMRRLFSTLLLSVHGDLGKPQTQRGEAVYRLSPPPSPSSKRPGPSRPLRARIR